MAAVGWPSGAFHQFYYAIVVEMVETNSLMQLKSVAYIYIYFFFLDF